MQTRKTETLIDNLRFISKRIRLQMKDFIPFERCLTDFVFILILIF